MTSISDVNLTGCIYPEFPAEWNSATAIVEAILVAAALEFQARMETRPSDPWGPTVAAELPPRFRFDTFGSLLRWGTYSDAEWNRGAVSDAPVANRLYFQSMTTSGERFGRLPLLAMVWKFTDYVLETFADLRRADMQNGYYEVLRRLDGTELNKHGTALFMASFQREWFASDPSRLTDLEAMYVNGESIRSGAGVLAPSGPMYSDSLWQTAFRLVELRSPEYFLVRLRHRRDPVLDVLDRGARLASMGARSIWPGWPS